MDCEFTLEISSETLTDCKTIHDFQVLYCFCLAVYIVIVLFSLGYNATIFNMQSIADAPTFIHLGMRVKMIVLLLLLATKSGLHLSYLGNCPWTSVLDNKQNYALEQVIHFVGTVCDTLIVYLTLCLSIGYSLSKVELTMFDLKFLFWMPCTRFFLSQVLLSLASFHFNIRILFVIMIAFDLVLMLTVACFMFRALRNIFRSLDYLRNRVSGNLEARNLIEKQLAFRKNKSIIIYCLILGYYGFQIFHSFIMAF